MANTSPPPIINMVHWTESATGTLVTKFNAAQLALYQAAVAQCGDHTIVVCDNPLSLHHRRQLSSNDLSHFWVVFKTIEAQVASGQAVLKSATPGLFWLDPPIRLKTRYDVPVAAPPDPYADYERAMGIVGKR